MVTRIRILSNGKWVAEVRKWYGWCGIWGYQGGYTAATWDMSYAFCWENTEQEAKNQLNNYFAQRGI